MIDALISGKLHAHPEQRTSKTGKTYATAKMTAAGGDGQSLFVNCIAFDEASVEALLALAWNIDTSSWCDRGLIYNITDARELITQGDADDDTALFECEWGSEGTKHVALADVDFFCTPRVRARLELALLQAHVGKVMEGGVA